MAYQFFVRRVRAYAYLCICLTCLVAFSNGVEAQRPHGKGFVYNAERYKQAVKMRDLEVRGGLLREQPLRVSLRPFCPSPQDQGMELSCTAWAIAYGALSIHQALYRGVADRADVDKMAYSKSFVFNQLCQGDPDRIPTLEETFEFLRQNGTCWAATFRNDLSVAEQPDALAFQEAASHKIAAMSEVYDPDTSIQLKRQVQRFKRLLADSVPIVIGVRLPFSFYNLAERTFHYDYTEPLDSAGHAMCLIGYDDVDSTFECLNSWGTTWGDGGFVRIKYEDIFNMLCCAYRLTPQFLAARKNAAPKGSVVLRHSVGYKGTDIPQYEEIRVRYDTTQRYYVVAESADLSNLSGFQLALRDIPDGWQVSIFNIGATNEVALLHQAPLPKNTVEKVIPHEAAQFEVDIEAGAEWLGILCTKKPLPDFQLPLQDFLKKQSGQPVDSARAYFKDILPYQTLHPQHRMGFSFPKGVRGGEAALFFLKIGR